MPEFMSPFLNGRDVEQTRIWSRIALHKTVISWSKVVLLEYSKYGTYDHKSMIEESRHSKETPEAKCCGNLTFRCKKLAEFDLWSVATQ
ncbi:hypothetical protein TESG_08289 [Trichophyton tonsurans CBS 112818]|uniref:Uncharacterized protein n=2 Tax=Trichophyton TaxID=5550 RepID=F2PLN0_TRIEC|nr:hypothetical protein TESG_08289 [Trichophyton tonsurans CBS 112818]EGE02798.1 hypothetical protein TEQG_08616 [Trichophyton equinum CBS 127.97]